MKSKSPPEDQSRPALAGLYAILDLSGDSPTEVSNLLELARELLAGGAKWFQLRAKKAPADKTLQLARELVILCNASKAKLIINDRMDIALAARAHGVHLGQTDLPAENARQLAPPRFLIGLSTHSSQQVQASTTRPIDYIGFGPIFPTASKADAESAKGIERLREVRSLTERPIVAIGGIELARVPEIFATGANAVAMIGALQRAKDPRGFPKLVAP